MNSFPWKNAMKFGLGVLHLSPDQFWAMTPRELGAAYEANEDFYNRSKPITRVDLAGLIDKFPDEEK